MTPWLTRLSVLLLSATAACQGGGAWVIRGDGVGAIRLDRPVPAAVLPGDLAQRYGVRYIADGQPLESVRLDRPPLTVAIADGPFSRRVAEAGLVEPDAGPFRVAGAAAIRGGARVQRILVQGAGPVTAAGVGVGSALSALKGAYGDLSLQPVPPTLGGDECVGATQALPQVHFVFASCPDAQAGKPVIRIDLWR